ncbi:MAG: adenylate cyclase, partial [Deltaproteobacteria bacterium]
ELERRVAERTAQLVEARAQLLELNSSLQQKVEAQLLELERHRELRRYLPPKIAERILKDGTEFGRNLQRKFMTIVFSDIRNFSSITDSLEPEEIVQLLNEYHSEMIEIVHSYGGTLNKIMGDGLVIFFGDPVDMDDHAHRAVHMAIEMQRRVKRLRKHWQSYGHDLGIGIGINTGYMTVGNIGSEAHKEYTVIGNQVNIAARLEQMAGAGQILATQRTLSQLNGAVQAEPMGEIEVKGIHSPIKIYKIPVF